MDGGLSHPSVAPISAPAMADTESAAQRDIEACVAGQDFKGLYTFCEGFELDMLHSEVRAYTPCTPHLSACSSKEAVQLCCWES